MQSNTTHLTQIFALPKDADPHRLLLAEFTHRIANDFAVACAEVSIARRTTSLEEARDRLAIVAERLFALASIQRLLQAPQDAAMALGRKIYELGQHHAQARFAEQGVLVRVRAADILVDSRRGWALLMIVSELLTNAARHAFDAPGGMVDVVLTVRDGEICCLVSDDGIGMPTARTMSGAGSAIVTALAGEAGIHFSLLSCRIGTGVQLRMPMEVISSQVHNRTAPP